MLIIVCMFIFDFLFHFSCWLDVDADINDYNIDFNFEVSTACNGMQYLRVRYVTFNNIVGYFAKQGFYREKRYSE